jgi:hypothetical protein
MTDRPKPVTHPAHRAGPTATASSDAANLEDVRRFLAEHIDGYEQLEALVYLARRRRRSSTAADVATGTRMLTLVAMKALYDLRRAGLVREIIEEGRTAFVFWPATPELAATADRFVALHEANPVDVIHLMNANALQRVRSSAAVLFADAFVIRRPR